MRSLDRLVTTRRVFEATAGPAAVGMGAVVGAAAKYDMGVAALAAGGTLAAQLFGDVLGEKVRQRQAQQVEVAIEVASRFAKLTPAEMQELADQPVWCRVLAETIDGAASATYFERIFALGRILGESNKAVDVAEQQELISQAVALRVLEEADVLVLNLVAKELPPETMGDDRKSEELVWTWIALNNIVKFHWLLTTVLARLEAQGLVHSAAGEDGTFWMATGIGVKVIDRLLEASRIPAEFMDQHDAETRPE